ncbi:Hsp20/alpha crystallin family protein [bacterium]|nr:MAG: Hsp20/alpha crystallin family protein [bacterium]
MAAKYAPLLLISRFQAELDRLFQEAVRLGESELPLGEWQPSVDVVETPASILLLAEVPGFSAADLKIEVRGTIVTLSGTKSTQLPEGVARVKFHCLERGHGRFCREVHLFSPVNTHQGTARLADGLLTIEFPKIEDKRREARVLHIEEDENERSEP